MNRSEYGHRFSLFPFICSKPPVTRTPDNSNLFLFPLNVRVIGIRLYIEISSLGRGKEEQVHSPGDTQFN